MISMSTDLIQSIVRLRRALTRAAATAFAGSGVGPRQLGVLRELRRAGPLLQVDLARSTATDPAGLMRAIDALEERGWVERSSSEQDRRCKRVSLTPRGKLALEELDVTYEPLRALAQGALTPAERRQFSALAEKLASAFEEAAQAPPAPPPPPPPPPPHTPPPPPSTPARNSPAGKRRTEHR
jgi:DNA-binding MarR family transcriptional regulator